MNGLGDKETDIVGIIPAYNNKVLYLHRSPEAKLFPGKWCIPSGHVKHGETEIDAAYRETIEETGIPKIKKESIKHLCRFDYDISTGGKKITLRIALFYLELADVPEIKLCDEHTDYRFIDIDALRAVGSTAIRGIDLRGSSTIRGDDLTPIDRYILKNFMANPEFFHNEPINNLKQKVKA